MALAETSLKSKWRRRKDARPQELLEAAFDVFVDKGFAAARLDDIAARAGVSKGTIYLYFSSKEDVFKAMVQNVAEARLEMAAAIIDGHQGSQAALIRQIVSMAGQFLRSPPLIHFPRLIVGESARFPELAGFYYREAISRGRSLFVKIIERGQASGEFRPIPARHAVHMLMAPLLFMALYTSVFQPHESEPFDHDGHIAAHLDIFLRGLCVEEPKS